MGKNGTFKLTMAALIVGLLGFALPASSIFQSPAVATIDASSTKGDQLMVCVDWTTKEIKYSKNWEACPSKHQNIMLGLEGPQGETGAQGPRGYSGSSGSSTTMWNSLSTCHQKLQAALQAGFIMPLKTDRDFFEASTGCIVEDIRDEAAIEIAQGMGLPYISNILAVSIGEATEGESFLNVYTYTILGYTTPITLTVKNGDALSAVDPNLRLCLFDYYGSPGNQRLVYLGGDQYSVTQTIRATPYQLTANFDLGFMTGEMGMKNCQKINYWEGFESSPSRPVVYSADPIQLPEDDPFRSYWGW
jgi:hypothetical protein